jgi:hypothetical protein
MASEVQIARLALQHLGDRFDITSLDEATPEAEQVNLVYDEVRDMVLRSHPWKFAKKFFVPAYLTGTPPADWGYMYTYPSDCVRMLRIVNPLGGGKPPIRFEIGLNSSGNKVILTNESEITIEYTSRVTDPNMYDSQFITGMAYRLAQYLAIPITGDRQRMADMQALADRELGMAMSTDANEGFEEVPMSEATWVDARS